MISRRRCRGICRGRSLPGAEHRPANGGFDRARRGPPSRRASFRGVQRQIQKRPAAQSQTPTVQRTVPKQSVRLTHRHRSSWVTMLRKAGPARSSAGPQPRGESSARVVRRDRGVIQRPLTVDCCLVLTRAIGPMQSRFSERPRGIHSPQFSPPENSDCSFLRRNFARFKAPSIQMERSRGSKCRQNQAFFASPECSHH